MNKYDEIMQRLSDFGGHRPPSTHNPLSEAELDALEQELGHSLPPDYRELLKDYGGFVIDSGVVFPDPKPDNLPYGLIGNFYGINPSNPWNDLITQYRWSGEGWPSEFLPIGAGDNGYMCLVIAGEEKDAVYFWNSGEDGSKSDPANFHFVARSFDEFLYMLKK